MARRQQSRGSRRAPESEYQRDMRRSLGNDDKENQPVDNRSLIPQLMRELTETYRYRRPLPYQPQQQQRPQQTDAAQAQPARRYRTPVPPRELPPVHIQTAQPGPSLRGGHRATIPSSLLREAAGGMRPKIKDAKIEETPRRLSPDEQFELDLKLAIERSLEENFTPLGCPFPDVQEVPEKRMPSGEQMIVYAEVHQEDTGKINVVSGEQLTPQGSNNPDHQAASKEISSEPVYAMPIKNKAGGAAKMDRAESPTPSSDSSGDRPPTPHPQSWLPAVMKYQEDNSPQNICPQQELEDKKQQGLQYKLTAEEQYQLDTQIAIQKSLQESFRPCHARTRSLIGDEIVIIRGRENQVKSYASRMPQTGSSQPAHHNMNAPACINEYAAIDGTVMTTAVGEALTNNEPGMVCTGPPKPARLYVRGVNAPPGMMEPDAAVVPCVPHLRCPPPSPDDDGWEDIISSLEKDEPQQESATEEQSNSCCKNCMEFLQSMGNFICHHLCCCEP